MVLIVSAPLGLLCFVQIAFQPIDHSRLDRRRSRPTVTVGSDRQVSAALIERHFEIAFHKFQVWKEKAGFRGARSNSEAWPTDPTFALQSADRRMAHVDATLTLPIPCLLRYHIPARSQVNSNTTRRRFRNLARRAYRLAANLCARYHAPDAPDSTSLQARPRLERDFINDHCLLIWGAAGSRF
jgi:hypothetical protein